MIDDIKIDNIKKKLKILEIELEGRQNDWALIIKKDELFGYIDISGKNQIVLPEYDVVRVMKHFIIFNKWGEVLYILVRGNTHNILEASNWSTKSSASLVPLREGIEYLIRGEDSKIQIFILEDNQGDRHIIAVNHLGKSFEIKASIKIEYITIQNRKYSPKTGKEICEIKLSRVTRETRDIVNLTLDEDLNITEYNMEQ